MRIPFRLLFGVALSTQLFTLALGVDGKIILKRILEKWDGASTGSIWLRTGTGGDLL